MPSRIADSESKIYATARVQFGLFNSAQARAAGFSQGQIDRRIANGRLTRVLPRVYAISGTPNGWRRDLMAGCLWAEPAAASHNAAAVLWSMPGFSEGEIEISTVCRRSPNGFPLTVHRVDRRLLGEIHRVEGIPVTSARRTLMDICGRRDWRAGRALDHVLREGIATLGDIWLLYDEEWTRGRRGIAILRTLSIERSKWAAPTDSDCARLFWRIVFEHGLPRPTPQHPVVLASGITVHLDFAYPDANLAIETDGYAFHSDREAFERDRERDAELQVLGWTPIRYTWAKLRFDPLFVVRSLRHHLGLG